MKSHISPLLSDSITKLSNVFSIESPFLRSFSGLSPYFSILFQFDQLKTPLDLFPVPGVTPEGAAYWSQGSAEARAVNLPGTSPELAPEPAPELTGTLRKKFWCICDCKIRLAIQENMQRYPTTAMEQPRFWGLEGDLFSYIGKLQFLGLGCESGWPRSGGTGKYRMRWLARLKNI
jgi:hypothetical protein